MKLYLDDVRPTPEDFELRAYTATEAIDLLLQGGVTFISFDHDLGEDDNGTGYDVAEWIEERAYFAEMPRLDWTIHSANPVGRKRIEDAMQHADRFWTADERSRDPSQIPALERWAKGWLDGD